MDCNVHGLTPPVLFRGQTFDRNQGAAPFARRPNGDLCRWAYSVRALVNGRARRADIDFHADRRRETRADEQAAAALPLPRHGAHHAFPVRRADAQPHGRRPSRGRRVLRRRSGLSLRQRHRRGVDRRAPLRLSSTGASARRIATSPPPPGPESSARSPATTPNSRPRSISPAAWSTSCAASPIPTRTQNGRVLGCFVLLLDITRERAFEAQMQTARDEAIEAIRSKSRFLAAASHDLRQPLHAMTLFVSALVAAPERAARAANWSATSTARCARSRAMIDTLLDISKTRRRPHQADPRRRWRSTDLFAALRAGLQRDGARPRPRIPRRRRPPPWSSATARWSNWRCATCSPTRSSSPAAAACWSAAGAGAANRRRRRRHRRRRRARPAERGVRGVPSRQDDARRPQRGHRPRPRHRPGVWRR